MINSKKMDNIEFLLADKRNCKSNNMQVFFRVKRNRVYMSTQTFYNTTSLTGSDLTQAIQSATKSEDAVLQIYKHRRCKLSPSDVWSTLDAAEYKIPITSVRRAITNLRKKGDLIMLADQKKGMYGAKETFWAINSLKHPANYTKQNLF